MPIHGVFGRLRVFDWVCTLFCQGMAISFQLPIALFYCRRPGFVFHLYVL